MRMLFELLYGYTVFCVFTGVVEYLVSGKIASNHEDFKDISYEEILHRICRKNEKDVLSHDFRLAKAYDDIMPFTNYT